MTRIAKPLTILLAAFVVLVLLALRGGLRTRENGVGELSDALSDGGWVNHYGEDR